MSSSQSDPKRKGRRNKSKKRPRGDPSAFVSRTSKRSVLELTGNDENEDDEEEKSMPMSMDDLSQLWRSANAYNSRAICELLLEPPPDLEDDETNDDCPLSRLTEYASILYGYLFGGATPTRDKMSPSRWKKELLISSELCNAHKMHIYRRAFFLLPSNSSAPWDATRAYLASSHRPREGGHHHATSSLLDINRFLSSVCPDRREIKFDRTMAAQADALLEVCKSMSKTFGLQESQTRMGSLSTIALSLVRASLRIDEYYKVQTQQKQLPPHESTIHKNSLNRTGAILGAILPFLPRKCAHGNELQTVHPSQVTSLLVTARELGEYFSPIHWHNLQYFLSRSLSMEKQIRSKDFVFVVKFILSQLPIDHHGTHSHNWDMSVRARWIRLILLIYRNSVHRGQVLVSVEEILLATLSRLSLDSINCLIEVIVEDSQEVVHTTDCGEPSNKERNPCWVHATILLIIFQSRIGTQWAHDLVVRIPGRSTNAISSDRSIFDSILSVVKNGLGEQDDRKSLEKLSIEAAVWLEFRRCFLHDDTHSMGSERQEKINQTQTTGEELHKIINKGMFIVKASLFLGPIECHSLGYSRESRCWKRKLWAHLVHHSLSSMVATSVTQERSALSGAILIAISLDDRSSRKNVIRDIICHFRDNHGSSASFDATLVYCWVLNVIAVGTSQREERHNESGRNKHTFVMNDQCHDFAPVFDFLRKRTPHVQKFVHKEVMRSISHFLGGREFLLKLTVQQMDYDSLQLRYSHNCNEEVTFGVEGLFVLIRDCISEKPLDNFGLHALRLISDMIIVKDSVTGPKHAALLTQLMYNHKEGNIHPVAVERILNASLTVLLGYFRVDSFQELVFVPDQCIGNGNYEDKLKFLSETILAALHFSATPQALDPGARMLTNEEVDEVLDVIVPRNHGHATTPKSKKMSITCSRSIALSCFRAITLYLMKGPVSSKTKTSPCDELWSRLCGSEQRFWESIYDGEGPEWLKDPHPNSYQVSDSTPNQIFSQALLRTVIVTVLLSSCNVSCIRVSSDKMVRKFRISFATNLMLTASLVSKSEKDGSSLNKISTVGNSCAAVASFFIITTQTFTSGTSNDWNFCGDKKESYFSLLPSSVLQICECTDQMIQKNDTPDTRKVLRSLVDFYFNVCSESRDRDAKDATGNYVNHSYRTTRFLHSMTHNDSVQDLRIAVLSSIWKILLNLTCHTSSSYTETSTASNFDGDDFHLCINLSYQLSRDLSSGPQERIDRITNSLQMKYVEIVRKLLTKAGQLLRHYEFRSLHEAEDKCYDMCLTLWRYVQKCRSLDPNRCCSLKSIIQICVSQLPQLHRQTIRLMAFSTRKRKQLTRGRDGTLERASLAALNLDYSAEDLKVYFSKGQLEDFSSNEFCLSLCLANIEHVWLETHQHILKETPWAIRIGILESQCPTIEELGLADFHRILFTELQATASSVALLLHSIEISGNNDDTRLPLKYDSLSPEIKEKIHSCLERVLITVCQSSTCITRYCRQLIGGDETEIFQPNQLSVSEAFICMIAWIQDGKSGKKTQPSRTTRSIAGAKFWYSKRKEEKPLHRKASNMASTLSRIEELQDDLMQLYRLMRTMDDIRFEKCIENLIKIFMPHIQENIEPIKEFVNALGDYLKMLNVYSADPIGYKLGEEVSTVRPTGRERKHNRNKGHARKELLRSRNGVVDEWLELDRNFNEKNAKDNFEDLEDFILPG